MESGNSFTDSEIKLFKYGAENAMVEKRVFKNSRNS